MTHRQLTSLARRFRKGILGKRESDGMCAAVCYPLQGYLSMCGLETKLITGDFSGSHQTWLNHVWLELPDGRVLDPTADQFGLVPIYLGPLPSLYQAWMKPEEQTNG